MVNPEAFGFYKPDIEFSLSLVRLDKNTWNRMMQQPMYGGGPRGLGYINRGFELNADLSGYVFNYCDMRASSYNNLPLKDAQFTNCTISDVYYQTHFVNADLENAVFSHCRMDSPALQFANLRNAKFEGTSFSQSSRIDYMYCTDLRGARFDDLRADVPNVTTGLRRALASSVIDEHTILPAWIPEESTPFMLDMHLPGKRAYRALKNYNLWLRENRVQPMDDPFLSLKQFMSDAQAATLAERFEALQASGRDMHEVMDSLRILARRMDVMPPSSSSSPHSIPSSSVTPSAASSPPAASLQLDISIAPLSVDDPSASINALLESMGATRDDIGQDIRITGEGGFQEIRFVGKTQFLEAFQSKGVPKQRAQEWFETLESANADAGITPGLTRVAVRLPFLQQGDFNKKHFRWQLNPTRFEIEEVVLNQLLAAYDRHQQRSSGHDGPA